MGVCMDAMQTQAPEAVAHQTAHRFRGITLTSVVDRQREPEGCLPVLFTYQRQQPDHLAIRPSFDGQVETLPLFEWLKVVLRRDVSPYPRFRCLDLRGSASEGWMRDTLEDILHIVFGDSPESEAFCRDP